MELKVIGWGLLAYFLLVVISRIQTGLAYNLWWVSHAVLPLAAIGFLRQDNDLLTASLVLVLIPHGLWIIDFFLIAVGVPSLGVTDYLEGAELINYLFTMHHFVLLPLLLWALYRQRKASAKGWMIAGAYFAFLTLGTILTTNPGYNVNCAFRVCEAAVLEPLYIFNVPSLAVYWLVENIIMLLFNFLPVNSLLVKAMK